MKNLTLLELDELNDLLNKLKDDDRLIHYSAEDQAITLLLKFVRYISLKSESRYN